VRTIGVVLPTIWDRRQLAASSPQWRDRFELVELGPDDADTPWDFDTARFLAETRAAQRGKLHGVFASSDYPGAQLAALLARDLGLAGPDPAAVLAAAHKFQARSVLARALPEATPAFAWLDPAAPAPWPWPGPAFVKPIKGCFSMHTARLGDERDLRRFLAQRSLGRYREGFVRIFEELRKAHAPWLPTADAFLLEELLRGELVTVEGFVAGGEVTILGTVDATVHPETGSFLRFDYPSALPQSVQARLHEYAATAARALGLDQTFFNVEMFFDAATGRIGIVEVNPRMCGQFADLWQKVDGHSSYELAMQLAAGETPVVPRRRGAFGAAASVPLRVFAACRVVRAPDPGRIAAVERSLPGLCVYGECEAGQELGDFAGEDGHSIRYAVLNLGASDRAGIGALVRRVEELLGYEFEPLGTC
jgi:hypothetical protein